MPSKTIDYIREKNELQKSIEWYVKTLQEIDKQQQDRRRRLDELREQLYNLEEDYYTNG